METYRTERCTEHLSGELTQISDFYFLLHCRFPPLLHFLSVQLFLLKGGVFIPVVACARKRRRHSPGRLYVAKLLSLLPLPAVQQLMLQSLWLEQELGHVSASQG